jgi:hypothetical protein
MKHRVFTIAILAALLVGCAASAMRFGAPQTVDASLDQSHVKQNVVTGPCYKAGGGNCASSFHFVHDNQLEYVATGCTNGTSCTLSPDILLSGNAIFANGNFDCTGSLVSPTSTSSWIWLAVVVNFRPLGSSTVGDGVDLGFRNETGSTIAYGTEVKVAYTCAGA